MFNLLKKRYHQSQIYSVESLSTLLNELDNVNYYHVTSEVFFDYNALLNHFYKSFPVGTVKRNHFFWVSEDNATTMHSREYYHSDSDDTVTAFDHCIIMENRLQLLSSARCNMRPMSAPGMKHIKQVELWQKWGPFIPEPYRDCLCAKPSDTVINAVAMERRSRQRSRIQSRRDSTR